MARPQFPRLILAPEFRAALENYTRRVLANVADEHESALSEKLASVAIPATPLTLDRLHRLARFVGYQGSLGADYDTGVPLPPDMQTALVAHREANATAKVRR